MFDNDISISFIIDATLIIASRLYIVKREWKQTKSLEPVLGNGNFRPDIGLRPRFALSRFFIHSVDNKKDSAEREKPIT